MKLKILNGVLIVDILSILLILSIIFIPSTAVRVILGLPFLLFFPGYTLTAALFVRKEGIDNIERAAISLGVSIAVVALIGLGLNYTQWGIRLEPVLYSVTAFIMVTSIVALIRRAKILKTNKFTTEFTLRFPTWGEGTFNKSLSIILVIAMFAAFGVLGYTIAVPKIGERFSEFYILGINGKAQDFPAEYVMNNRQITQVIYSKGTVDVISGLGAITMGIVNNEQHTADYYVKMTIDDEPVRINFGGVLTDVLGPIILQQGEKWENAINIVPQYIRDNQKVELLLFEGADTTPINSTHLWINVKSAKSDATLSNLTITEGTLTPVFAASTVSYTASVSNRVNSITVTPTVNESHATVTVSGNPVTSGTRSGNINLNVGNNTVTIVVTAEDTSTKTYTLTVNRAIQPSNDATLGNLAISSGILTPAFASSTSSYTTRVSNDMIFFTVTPTANDSGATITVNGNPVNSGSSSGNISLNVGDNTITMVVTAEDTSFTMTYTVTVTRAELSP